MRKHRSRVHDHTLIVGLLSAFGCDRSAVDFPAGAYLERCFAAPEVCFRALGAPDRRATDAAISFPS